MTCYKTFTPIDNVILYGIKKGFLARKEYVHYTIEKYSLRKTTEICNISLFAVFARRHKILDTLQKMRENTKLDGIIEPDEIFMSISYEGQYKDFNFQCLTKKRERVNTKRGLSKESVCIPYAANLSSKSIAKIENLGKSSVKALNNIISGKVEKESIFVNIVIGSAVPILVS